MFHEGIESGNKRNFRTYVGPGADDISDDKIAIDMKFTPDLKFIHDESFGTAAYMDKLFLDPKVQQDTRRLSDVLDEDED